MQYLRSAYNRRTNNVFGATPQFWERHADATLWWDLNYLHVAMCNSTKEVKLSKRREFLKQFTSLLTKHPSRQPAWQLATAAPSPNTEQFLVANMCNSAALLTFCIASTDSSRSNATAGFWLGLIHEYCRRLCETIPTTTFQVDIGGVGLRLRRDGQCENFSKAISAGPTRVRDMICNHWCLLFGAGVVQCDLRRETHNLKDVVTCMTTVLRDRRAARRPISHSLLNFTQMFMEKLAIGLATCLDAYCSATFREGDPVAMSPPPALRRTGGETRGYVKTTPEAAWELLEKARGSRTNVEQALRLRNDQDTLGCCSSVGLSWINKSLQLYYERCELGFDPRDVYHWNLVADPGHHSYKECLVSLLYSWETNGGCFPPWQYLLPGKTVTPFDCNLDESIEDFAARRKCERVAAYRQLQGCSAQISWLTKGDLELDDFSLPSDANVRPVGPFEKRETTVVGDKNIDFIVDQRTNERKQVLPPWLVKVRLLLLMLDHGSVGAAGVAFGALALGKLIWAKWDPIHRLIRDMKNSENKTLGKIFLKTKLWSAYVFSTNSRPFGSGANFPLKQRLLDIVRLTETIDSPTFLKYLTRIGKAFNMPVETRKERQDLFNRVLEMKSFNGKGSVPKMQNWFAWNQAYNKQIGEYYPTKFVYETQLAVF